MQHFGTTPQHLLSRSVRAGDWVYVSGQASTDRETGEFIAGTFEQEFRRSIDNLDFALAEAGCSREHLVKVGAFVRDESALPHFNDLYRAEFAHPRPARTTVAMGFAFLQFEIDAVAYLGE